MEAFLLQRPSSFQRLGNSPSAGLPAAPSPTQRARGAATQMALRSVCLLMVNTQLFAGTCIVLLKQLVAQQTLGTRRLHTPRLQFFPGDPRKCVNFEMAQSWTCFCTHSSLSSVPLVHSGPVVGQEANFIHCSHLHESPGEWLCRKYSPECGSEPPGGPSNPTYSGHHLSCAQG